VVSERDVKNGAEGALFLASRAEPDGHSLLGPPDNRKIDIKIY